jgi:nucleoside-diphosphate-sugar epimerase
VSIFLTGYTGNVGQTIAAALPTARILALVRDLSTAPRRSNVQLVPGSLDALPEGCTDQIEIIIHAAADTSFTAPLDTLRRTNVEGTAQLLAFAGECPRLRRFIHLSTVCVSGKSTGLIGEASLPQPEFVNAYEQTKWEAEQLVLQAALPTEIVRLSTVVGRESDGRTVRLGALHHAMYWLWRGLIPMIPGEANARVDLISAEHAADAIVRLLREPVRSSSVHHIAAGQSAAPLGELLDVIFAIFARHHAAWARGAIARPDLADAKTWALFSAVIARSGDALFARVIHDAQSFLPGLLHPRTYATSRPAPHWRTVVERTVEHLIRTDWHRSHD